MQSPSDLAGPQNRRRAGCGIFVLPNLVLPSFRMSLAPLPATRHLNPAA
jgi:hypothetical protein